MTSPITTPITAPMTRLQAIVLLRQTMRKLLGHIPNPEMRAVAGHALVETSHVLAEVRPANFGWAVRPAGDPTAPWTLEFDAGQAHYSTKALDQTGKSLFEVIGLAAMPTPELPAPALVLETTAAETTASEAA